jgi:hypothetical protein
VLADRGRELHRRLEVLSDDWDHSADDRDRFEGVDGCLDFAHLDGSEIRGSDGRDGAGRGTSWTKRALDGRRRHPARPARTAHTLLLGVGRLFVIDHVPLSRFSDLSAER